MTPKTIRPGSIPVTSPIFILVKIIKTTTTLYNAGDGIRKANETGLGKIFIKARTNFEEEKGKSAIIITEIPCFWYANAVKVGLQESKKSPTFAIELNKLFVVKLMNV